MSKLERYDLRKTLYQLLFNTDSYDRPSDKDNMRKIALTFGFQKYEDYVRTHENYTIPDRITPVLLKLINSEHRHTLFKVMQLQREKANEGQHDLPI